MAPRARQLLAEEIRGPRDAIELDRAVPVESHEQPSS
jgi:hypothetical protein